MRIAIVALALAACPEPAPDWTWELRTATDEGSVCVEGAVDEMANVVVIADDCQSSSCTRNQVRSCSADLDGTTITVTSAFEWETAVGDVDCTDDCQPLGAGCEVGPLAAGTYTIQHGDDETVVTIPTSDPCGGI